MVDEKKTIVVEWVLGGKPKIRKLSQAFALSQSHDRREKVNASGGKVGLGESTLSDWACDSGEFKYC
jgi:hypothetical protein